VNNSVYHVSVYNSVYHVSVYNFIVYNGWYYPATEFLMSNVSRSYPLILFNVLPENILALQEEEKVIVEVYIETTGILKVDKSDVSISVIVFIVIVTCLILL